MPKETPISVGASELRIVLGQLVRRLRAEHTFSIMQGSVLGRLDREGPLTASALATAERVRPQSMAQTVGELEEAGLVARSPDPSDKRQTLIELTREGRARLKEERRLREGWLTETIATRLTPKEQETLLAALPLLERIATS
jgi:DNA-binding MarR family transcriptional regulator